MILLKDTDTRCRIVQIQRRITDKILYKIASTWIDAEYIQFSDQTSPNGLSSHMYSPSLAWLIGCGISRNWKSNSVFKKAKVICSELSVCTVPM